MYKALHSDPSITAAEDGIQDLVHARHVFYTVVLHSLYLSIYVIELRTQKVLLKQYSQTSHEQVPWNSR